MSSTPIDSWAVDLANVSFIYPWVGAEGVMAIVAIVLWLLWHVWQLGFEKREFDNEIERYGGPQEIKKYIDGDD